MEMRYSIGLGFDVPLMNVDLGKKKTTTKKSKRKATEGMVMGRSIQRVSLGPKKQTRAELEGVPVSRCPRLAIE